MKIAAITDDGKTISLHFGRAQQYLVATVENGQIVSSRDARQNELYPLPGRRSWA